jgi:hypothetical protein
VFANNQPYLIVDDMRGGVNDSDSPISLQDNELIDSRNVDYRFGHIGNKRGGTTAIPLTGSVFNRAVPAHLTTFTTSFNSGSGGGTVAAGGSVATNQVLLVYVGAPGIAVTGITFNGVALTSLAILTSGIRTEIWYLKAPTINAATLTVTMASSTTVAVIAQRWDNVDNTLNPGAGATNTGTSNTPSVSSAAYDATSMVSALFGWNNNIAATLDGFGAYDSANVQQGTNVSIAVESKLGALATTLMQNTLTGTPTWAASLVSLKGITQAASAMQIMWIGTHTPTNQPLNDELWAQDVNGRLDRMVNGTWQGGVPVVNYQVGSYLTGGSFSNAVSLHGKYFLSLDGILYADRMLVWDGTILRWGGISQPPVLTVANTGVGAYTGTRYFRYRLTQTSGSTILRRSEPCTNVTFTPSGTGSGALLTLPTAISAPTFANNEGWTTWEIEASIDGANFYVIATQPIATNTYTDSAAFGPATYVVAANLSELIGNYVPMLSVRHLTWDEDRLMGGGSRTTAASDSRVYWTPLTADFGVGNDERVPTPVGSRYFLDLDGLNGGRLNMQLPATFGGILCFKDQRVYKLLRTGRPTKAYDSQLLTPARGAMPRAAIYGTDHKGQPCVYFWDQNVGGVAFGSLGFVDLHQNRRRFVQTVNKAATTSVVVMFYPKHWLVWFFVSTAANLTPNYVLCFNARQQTTTDYDGNMGKVVSGTIFKDRTSLEMRPYTVTTVPNVSPIVESDKGINDDGTYFRGYFTSKAYQAGQLFRNWRVKGAILFGKAATGVSIGIGLIRDTGAERIDKIGSIDPGGAGNTFVSTPIDDAFISEAKQVTVEIGDPISYVGAQLGQTWQMDQVVCKFGTDDEGMSA